MDLLAVVLFLAWLGAVIFIGWGAWKLLQSMREDTQRRHDAAQKAEKAFQHIMEHGTVEEKQLAMQYKQNQQFSALIGMVALGIFLDQ